MIPQPAQYLLRFDDLCPTMDRKRWQRFLPLMEELGIRPILAVVPENRDPDLEVADADPRFWSEMRRLETVGATIGLHGCNHLCESRGRSLVPLHRRTEFAGVDKAAQREWIRQGLEILCGHGLSPRIWVAPRHGFDANTLIALREEGIRLLSDGFARVPFVRGGLTWMPQQLWEPVEKRCGVWTICLHSNSASDELVRRLEDFAWRHAGQFRSLDRVLFELRPEELSLSERAYESAALFKVRASRKLKRLFIGG
jgi:predicted deacetylase